MKLSFDTPDLHHGLGGSSEMTVMEIQMPVFQNDTDLPLVLLPHTLGNCCKAIMLQSDNWKIVALL